MPLPDPFIIGFSGRAGAGKDTAAEHLVSTYGFHRFAFADPLRDMLFALLDSAGIDHAWITEPGLKEQPIQGLGVSYRHMAQTLGTEWARAQFGDDFWVRTAETALGLRGIHRDLRCAPVHDRIVIPDVRFRNEADWIHALGGVVIRITRPGQPEVREHVSESQLDGFHAWGHVNNAGTPAELHRQLDCLMGRLSVLRATRANSPEASHA